MKTVILLLSLTFCLLSSVAQIINIPADYTSIQAGINAATDGDTVLVADGTYLENINYLGKAITVASHFLMDADTNHINNTIIDGSQPSHNDSASVVLLCSYEDTTSVLCGFTITGGSGFKFMAWDYFMRSGGGIACYRSGAKIIHNKIINNAAHYYSYGFGGGISLFSDSNNCWVVICNNTVKSNTASADEEMAYGGGIYISRNARIVGNVIDNNYTHLLSSSGSAQGGGIFVESTTLIPPYCVLILHGNTIRNNVVEGGLEATGGGYMSGDFFPSPASTITNNVFENNSTVGTRGWGTAMFLTKIKGNILIEDNTFRNNFANTTATCGATIYINSPLAEVRVLNNIFSNNIAEGNDLAWGSVIWIWDAEDTFVEVDGNHFLDNTADYIGGFYARNSYNYHLTNNLFKGNAALGNTYNITGAAVYLHQYYGKDDPQDPFDKNSQLPRQTRSHKSSSLRPLIANNTFVGNYSENYCGVVTFASTYDSLCPIFMNNIFWENESANGSPYDICYSGTENLRIYNNRISPDYIYGNWEGEGNIPENPDFDTDTCHLLWYSPCIGAGIDSLEVDGLVYYCPVSDIDGDPRPQAGAVDIGADETPFWVGIENDSQGIDFNLQINPNPINNKSDIRYQIPDIRYIQLEILNLNGHIVTTLVNQVQGAGEHMVSFDASGLPAGVYFIRLRAADATAVRKVVVSH